jgi:exopolysaccharide biosynthesis protein
MTISSVTLRPAGSRPGRSSWRRRGAAATLCTAAALAGLAIPATSTGAAVQATGAAARRPLDLGPADLPETRTTSTLQRGVTLTRITRGTPDPSLRWTEEILIPASSTSPDPDAPPQAISDRASARAQAARLAEKGFDARVERVRQPRMADVAPGVLGYRVRVGSFATQEEADAEKARLAAAGETASTVYTGWDGRRTDRGPWHVNVLRIDPRRFTGHLVGSFGPDLFQRETTSQLAALGGATAAVNGGYFVLDAAAGAPGDPAGAGVYDGRVLSESVDGRPVLILHDDARRSSVRRLHWTGRMRVDGDATALDGVNRVPGLIRNCGGDATDEPTSRPRHDFTCTDTAELVAFSRHYGASTPAGPGREVVVEHGVVAAVSKSRGTALTRGQHSVQATGTDTELLAGVQVGDRLRLRLRLMSRGTRLRTPSGTTVTNGGPLLMRNGSIRITQRRDGFARPNDPSFAYGFVIKRNPRTLAGIDAKRRTVLVTVDGRSADDLGLSVRESADVARSLGLVDAINLDGGGSTTMVVNGAVITHPSDPEGERPVGDAVLITRR